MLFHKEDMLLSCLSSMEAHYRAKCIYKLQLKEETKRTMHTWNPQKNAYTYLMITSVSIVSGTASA